MSKPSDPSTYNALTGVIELVTRGDTSITTLSMAVVLLKQYRQEIEDRGFKPTKLGEIHNDE